MTSERRLVSILFADLVGFTAIAEGRDAEDVRDLLTRYFDLAKDVIGRYGGSVEKFIGDAVMAVWGAPVAHEDDAERAVRAGLELIDAIHALGPDIDARAGILTGEAAVTIGAVDQGIVAGDLVNTASRLQSVAPPGAVLVGEATRRSAARAVAFEPAGERMLKGRAAPVAAYRAVRVIGQRGGRGREGPLEAPFVGRDDELRFLKDLYHATVRERRARLVSVSGPAGIGKSRLAWEFLKYIDGLVETIWWHDGQSPAYGESISFWALGEMVRARAGLAEDADETTTRTKVGEMVAAHIADIEERRWIEPALLALLGHGGAVPSEQLFGAWRTFFERLGASAPVVLVFEDFHHADTGLLGFVDELVDWSRTSPILVVTLARPELLERRPDWGASKRSFTSLHLEPLSEPAMRALLEGLVPGLAEDAVRSIVARADGVPLYAVETVRMLLADRRLEVRDGSYVPLTDLGSLAVPETLTALISSRLDALGAAERSLVSDASVLGQSFSVEALATVGGLDETELATRLQGLLRREILARSRDPRSPERGQYTFVQGLIREVAYNTLSRPERKARHLAAARYLEAVGSDELAGALAGHYIAAQVNAPEGPEREALAGQARLALVGAAARAAALGSHDQAIGFLEQALPITQDPASRAQVLSGIGVSAAKAGRYELAAESLEDAADLSRSTGDRRAAAATVGLLGEALLTARRTTDAVALLETAVREFEDLAPDAATVAIQGQLARGYFLDSQHHRAVEAAERVLETAEHGGMPRILADTLVTKGSALASLGRLREGLGLIRIGEQVARENDLADTQLRALGNVLAMQGFDVEADAVRGLAEDVLELARRVGDRGSVTDALQTLGWCSIVLDLDVGRALVTWQGQSEEALEPADEILAVHDIAIIQAWRGESARGSLERLETLASRLTEPAFRSMPEDASGWLALAEGRYDDARRHWEARIDVNPDARRFLLGWIGRAMLWAGDEAAVADCADRLDGTGFRLPAVELRLAGLRAGISALAGERGDALARYRGVLEGWQRLGQPWEEAFTAMDMVAVLDPSNPEVRAAAARAFGFVDRLGAKAFASRLTPALTVSGAEGPAQG